MKVKRSVEDRKGIIGFSSGAAFLGLSTFRTPYDAYLEYIGERPELTDEEKERFEMGHALEDFIAKQAERKYGVKVRKSNYAYINPKYPHLLCHPDRLVAGEIYGERIAIEIKSNTAFDRRWGAEDTDEIPMDYLVQVLGYFISEVPCDAVWLIRFSNNQLSRYIIRPNKELQDDIARKLEDIAKRIDSGWKPEPTTFEEAKKIFNAPTKDSIEADNAIKEIVNRLDEIKSELKGLSSEEEMLKKEIISYMKDRSILTYQGQTLAKYSQITKSGFDSKRFAAEHPDLYAEYTITTSYMKLS